MIRMIKATLVLFVIVAVLIMSYAILAEPISLICDTLIDISGSGISDEADDEIAMIPYFFAAAIVFGILLAMILYAIYGHKAEHEQYERRYR